jgi:hypothetical protein
MARDKKNLQKKENVFRVVVLSSGNPDYLRRKMNNSKSKQKIRCMFTCMSLIKNIIRLLIKGQASQRRECVYPAAQSLSDQNTD